MKESFLTINYFCKKYNIHSAMDLLNECNVIKYSAYRTAAKVRALQKALRLEHVRLAIVCGVFFRHNLRPAQNHDILNRNEIESVVHDILFASQKETSYEMHIALTTQKILQVIHNIFNRHKNEIRVLSVKVALTILCHARLQEKYQYLFHQLADHNSCLTKRRMELLLTEFAEITEFLSESVSFGTHLISSTLSSCFQHCDGNMGVTEESFMCWILNEPQTLVWLSTLYRMQTAEKVCHFVKCDFCKMYPIRGLRYMCLLCFKYNQCQTCFFLGRVNKRHKLKHPIQEYCYETSSKEATYAFLKVLRNKLKRHPTKDMHYLPIEPHDICIQNQYDRSNSSSACSIYHSSLYIAHNELPSKTVVNHYHTVLPVNSQTELQSIIHNLEEENRQLIAQIEDHNDPNFENYLQDHKEQIGAQVERLKLLKFHLTKVNELLPLKALQSQNGCQQRLCRLESTPIIPKSLKNYKQGLALPPGLDSISPIVRDTDRTVKSINMSLWQSAQEENCGMNASAESISCVLPSLSEHSLHDLSVCMFKGSVNNDPDCASGLSEWIQKPKTSQQNMSEINKDIDNIIEKLQKVLSSNFSLQDMLSDQDNAQLQEAATEMEGLLAGLIKSIEHNRCGNVGDSSCSQIFV